MRKFILAFGLLSSLAASATAADVSTEAAGSIVNVKLYETNDDVDLSQNMGLGIGMGGDMSKAVMFVEADKFAVKAGLVTFRATNASDDMIHELLVAPIAGMDNRLPYKDTDQQVDEDAAGSLGEVADLEPGKSGELTLDLKPGYYALFCNIPGHYMAGMWKIIAVQ